MFVRRHNYPIYIYFETLHKFADNNGGLIGWTFRLYEFDYIVEYTFFSRPQVTSKYENIEFKSELRSSGSYITENRKWDAQVRSLSSKMSKVSYINKRLKEIMSCYMIRCFYSSLTNKCTPLFKKIH